MVELTTAPEIMDVLGGNQGVASLTGSAPSAVSNWRAFNRFPSRVYIVMTKALADLGYIAPPALWRMTPFHGVKDTND